MTVAALAMWVITTLGGLYLQAIWLIEYDRTFSTPQRPSAYPGTAARCCPARSGAGAR
jgi:hypothetical protein